MDHTKELVTRNLNVVFALVYHLENSMQMRRLLTTNLMSKVGHGHVQGI